MHIIMYIYRHSNFGTRIVDATLSQADIKITGLNILPKNSCASWPAIVGHRTLQTKKNGTSGRSMWTSGDVRKSLSLHSWSADLFPLKPCCTMLQKSFPDFILIWNAAIWAISVREIVLAFRLGFKMLEGDGTGHWSSPYLLSQDVGRFHGTDKRKPRVIQIIQGCVPLNVSFKPVLAGSDLFSAKTLVVQLANYPHCRFGLADSPHVTQKRKQQNSNVHWLSKSADFSCLVWI